MARLLVVALVALTVGPLPVHAEGGRFGDALEQRYHELRGARRFVYVDAKGREVMVEHLENVPERFRDSVRPLYTDEPSSALAFDVLAADRAPDQTLYRYAEDGRTVYTNVVERVPVEQRETAAIDLSRVSLHTELGNDINRALREEHRRLTASPYCGRLREAVGASAWRRMWEDYAPLIVCGALLVAFLLFTPFALRRIEASTWARTLTMGIPMIALAGLAAFVMRTTNRTITDLNARVRPCMMATWGHLAEDDEPYSLAAHARRIRELEQEIEHATDAHARSARPLGQ